MTIKNNPFLSSTFLKIWKDHFIDNEQEVLLDEFPGLEFYQAKAGVYINAGRNLTKGISYDPNFSNGLNLKNKVVLLYDVPEYFDIPSRELPENIEFHKIKQYPGFMIELKKFKGYEDFLAQRFSKSSRYKLKKYKKRLETSFDITYRMYGTDIDETTYKTLFTNFKALLDKRFDDKEIYNNNLDPAEWNFYQEVVYPMMKEGKAGIFVVEDKGIPVCVTLCYFSEKVIFDAITVFDIDYGKFHPGSVTLMGLLEWAFQNQYDILDLTKGYFDYKTRWMTDSYPFHYHLYYDRSSLRSNITGKVMKSYFELKQTMREKNYNEKLHKLTFLINKKPKISVEQPVSFQFENVESRPNNSDLIEIPSENGISPLYKQVLFEFLYLFQDNAYKTKIYSYSNEQHVLLIEGENNLKKVLFQIQ
ncbi:GNAT family N-acetyltransferase [Robertkochia solimangrovi]|uniref:GNAT family N-acetyltransferase n=1 Tax=Robertkochia solimangrovi TaxID=2213046 RepID=UPI00117CD866|nr:GNAT family N-acetyltransferase [Robertkochia solimangrovi]TRZ42532.1 hypothetical protein DMZ48_13605 [Robertkochia solimangrovi]